MGLEIKKRLGLKVTTFTVPNKFDLEVEKGGQRAAVNLLGERNGFEYRDARDSSLSHIPVRI